MVAQQIANLLVLSSILSASFFFFAILIELFFLLQSPQRQHVLCFFSPTTSNTLVLWLAADKATMCIGNTLFKIGRSLMAIAERQVAS